MNSIMEKIQIIINVFTRVVTTIFIIASIYIFFFWGTKTIWSVYDILSILLIGLVSALFQIPFLTEKEHSKKVTLFLNILYFLMVNAFSLLMGFIRKWFIVEKMMTIVCFEAVIILVYTIVMFVSYKIDFDSAEKMNKKLQNRKEMQKEQL